jgi:hypothetical protein
MQIRTSLGREHSFAPYISTFQQQYQVDLYHFRQGTPLGLFFKDQSAGDAHHVIGASYESSERVSSESTANTPNWPKLLLQPPSTANFHWYYSEASLAKVTTITICESQDDGRPLGAWITYTNGTAAVLGQWRRLFTNLTKHVISSTSVMHWRERNKDTTHVWITASHSHDECTHSVDFSGTLVWYFSSTASVLKHVPHAGK